MKAWVLHGVGDFVLETLRQPRVGAGEALIRVRAAGVCGSDVQRVFHTGAHVHPLVIGHEFSGTVAEVGAEGDAGWLGRRVGIYPLIPCGKCPYCLGGQYELCRDYSYLGSRRDGGFAEYAAVPVRNLVELPEGVGFEEAAMLEPMAVAVHAMRRVMPHKEGTVAVCGLGTIGMLLMMFLREAGVERVLVIGNKDFQKERAVCAGVPGDCCFDSRRGSAARWVMDRTGGMGADVFFECVGRNETLAEAVEGTAPGGRICLVGNPRSSMELDRDVYWKLLRNQLTVTGTWNSTFGGFAYGHMRTEGTRTPGGGATLGEASRIQTGTEERGFRGDAESAAPGGAEDDWRYVLERLSKGGVSPGILISHRLPLEGLMSGLRIMREKSEEYGKVMCVF